jgi:hypothetical protein
MFACIFESKFTNLNQAKIAANHLSMELGDKIQKFNINSLSITIVSVRVFRLFANLKTTVICIISSNLLLHYANKWSKLSLSNPVASQESLYSIIKVKPQWKQLN